jgi:glutamate/tyrosine decarboxylase-like PLP-dependent enzyme
MTDTKTRSVFGHVSKTIDDLPQPGSPAPTAWFLGPMAENQAFLTGLVGKAVAAHSEFRKEYGKNDPPFATKQQLDGLAHQATCKQTEKAFDEFLHMLQSSVPLASYRNQSHMYWDLSLPGTAGYFAAMLYNQNNVAAEASPVTTAMEIKVAQQICTMLGYDTRAKIPPWGHITCDGSVANLEAMWAARNLSYHAVAISAALEEDERLRDGRNVTVKTGDGRREKLLDLTRWEQMNLPIGERLALSQRVIDTGGIEEDLLSKAMNARTLQTLGAYEFHARYLPRLRGTPVVIVPATAHYSWAKGAAILGLGMAEVWPVAVDLDGRMRMAELRKLLERAMAEQRPVAQVVAVMGTTGEGAVDPLRDLVEMREEYQERGLSYAIHADAAWGGYFASMLRPPSHNALEDPDQRMAFDPAPIEALSDHATKHLMALADADSITVDPHKSGFIPYPAGCLCYRDQRMLGLIAVTSPVVFHGGKAPTVGVYGVEGSKPGAAAAATLMSHTVIPPDASGYGRILGRCVFGAKRFYAATVSLHSDDTPYTITPFIRLPAEVDGATEVEIEEQRRQIATELVPRENPELLALFEDQPELKQLFRRLGPDLTVFAYAANFRVRGQINRDIGLMNELNDLIFRALSVETVEADGPPTVPMIVTASAHDPAVWGQDAVDSFARRAGLDPTPGAPIKHLISTMQNPWVTATSAGNMIPTLMQVLDKTIRDAARAVIERHGLE